MTANQPTNLRQLSKSRPIGRVRSVDGAMIWASGLSAATAIGDQVRLDQQFGERSGEVVRIEEDRVGILPDFGTAGISLGDRIVSHGPIRITPGPHWIGRILDSCGKPLDGKPMAYGHEPRGLEGSPPAAATRKGFGPQVRTGLTMFDTVLPIATGQRLGLFAGSGVGKSTLLAQMAQGMAADVVVLCLVGERGRELSEFVQNNLGEEGLSRTVIVVATSDRPAIERRRCLYTAVAAAESFRDQGLHVLLLVDSITRFAEAHREVATTAGELPAIQGFPASTAHRIHSLCERLGTGGVGQGDITALISVLVAGSDMDEPIADILRGVLDGHVVLDRTIAERGRFPATHILQSVSRSLPRVLSHSQNTLLSEVRSLLSVYEQSEPMLRSGLYRGGSDPVLERAIAFWPQFEQFVQTANPGNPEDAFQKLELLLKRLPGNGASG